MTQIKNLYVFFFSNRNQYATNNSIACVRFELAMAEAELNEIRREKKNMTCADCPAKCDSMLGGFGAVVVPYKSFVW